MNTVFLLVVFVFTGVKCLDDITVKTWNPMVLAGSVIPADVYPIEGTTAILAMMNCLALSDCYVVCPNANGTFFYASEVLTSMDCPDSSRTCWTKTKGKQIK